MQIKIQLVWFGLIGPTRPLSGVLKLAQNSIVIYLGYFKSKWNFAVNYYNYLYVRLIFLPMDERKPER